MKGKKILVVDDDQIVLNSCKRILNTEGYTVILVSSAKEAMEKLKAEYFNIMILDVKMPEKDGFYLLEKIREKWPLPKWPELPVLVMTGYPTPETITALANRGTKHFISKPFTPDELITSVNEVLKRSKKDESHGNR